MKHSHSTALAVALAMLLLSFGQASTPGSLRYQSAFADYKPYEDLATGNWRALNDTMRGAGGEMAHGMAMPRASASASAPSKTAPMAPMKGPTDHGTPGGMK
jgi:hypothetical protein